MGNYIIVFFIQNVIIFSLIFWLLTFLAEAFYSKKNQFSKKQFYECGFKSITDLNLQINLNFSLIAIFLILYDVEFTFLFPILFNFSFACAISFILFLIFFMFLILCLIFDFQLNSLNWYY